MTRHELIVDSSRWYTFTKESIMASAVDVSTVDVPETDSFILEYPKLDRDVLIVFTEENKVLVPKEFAGVFEYLYMIYEMENDDLPEGEVVVVKFPADEVPVSGLKAMIRFLEMFLTEGKGHIPRVKYPKGYYKSPSTFALHRYGFPKWMITFFQSVTLTEVFDMFQTVETLRFPAMIVLLSAFVASYINRLPEDVFMAVFTPKPAPLEKEGKGREDGKEEEGKGGSAEASTTPVREESDTSKLFVPYDKIQQFIERNPWAKNKDDGAYFEETPISPEADEFSAKARAVKFANRLGGPNDDPALVDGLLRILTSSYKRIVRFI